MSLRAFQHACAWAGLSMVALGLLSPALAQDDPEAQRRAFLGAYQGAEAGLPAPEGGDDPALVGYPLYPYVLGARLRTRMGAPADSTAGLVEEVEAFLGLYGEEPVGRWVRRPWLTHLAQRRAWEAFLRAYSQADRPGQALRCQALQARIALGQPEGLPEDAALVRLWAPRILRQ